MQMRYYTIPPPPPLAHIVQYYWALECTLAPGQTYTHRSMASGCAEMFFHYRQSFSQVLPDATTQQCSYSGFHAQTQHYTRFHTTGSFGIFGAYLFPGAIPQLFALPAAALSDHIPDLHSLLGQSGKNLEEKIMLAQNNQQRAQLLSSFFEECLRKNETTLSPVCRLIRQMAQRSDTTQVQPLAAQCHLSVRQLERQFLHYAGFSPKRFARITRFQLAMNHYGQLDTSLTQLAYDCGYYDQSHFIHDFKTFSGHHPEHYFFHAAEGTEWRDAG
jgi:AraC-like DNA-binding protein